MRIEKINNIERIPKEKRQRKRERKKRWGGGREKSMAIKDRRKVTNKE